MSDSQVGANANASRRTGQKWTSEEDDEMLQKILDGVTLDEIAVQHWRTYGGVKNRLLKLLQNMIQDGKLTLDEACAKFKVTPKDLDDFRLTNLERQYEKRKNMKAPVQSVAPTQQSSKPPSPPSRNTTTKDNSNNNINTSPVNDGGANSGDKSRREAALSPLITRECIGLLRDIRDYLKIIAKESRKHS